MKRIKHHYVGLKIVIGEMSINSQSGFEQMKRLAL